MAKPGTLDENMFEAEVDTSVKKGRQEDGTYITSSGEVLAAKKPRREPYPEPEDKQVAGLERTVESPDGSVSFTAVRMDDADWARASRPERKRLQCRWKMTEAYAGQPRPYYSWDELEQIEKGELKR